MNPIILGFADGTTFFVGLAMTFIADLLLLRFRVGPMRAVFTVLAMVGIIFVVISATPLPAWAYAIWLISATAALAAGNLARCPRNARLILAGLAVLTTTAFALAEFPHRRLPHIDVPRGATIYVIGDSISAGVGMKEKLWPAVLAEMTSLSVVNLARDGAKVQSAREASRWPCRTQRSGHFGNRRKRPPRRRRRDGLSGAARPFSLHDSRAQTSGFDDGTSPFPVLQLLRGGAAEHCRQVQRCHVAQAMLHEGVGNEEWNVGRPAPIAKRSQCIGGDRCRGSAERIEESDRGQGGPKTATCVCHDQPSVGAQLVQQCRLVVSGRCKRLRRRTSDGRGSQSRGFGQAQSIGELAV